MLRQTDDLRITQVRPLIPPAILLEELPLGERASNVISNTRLAVSETLKGAILGWSSSPDPAPFTTPQRRSNTRRVSRSSPSATPIT